ncbi:MAG: hypothetical protein B6I36_05445 [Desulfobacteraceae bacterium 4572_35.1]|nr:MAG: hypothetical protein B6I36_05445 [Desulfobacteraceae bacterium 4572_35.1]
MKIMLWMWIIAAVTGSLWACMEIVVGSFLHNLHLPLAGSVMTALVIVFLVALHELWPEQGLVWRAGLICAAMKSLSPGAVILGPMVAIVAEALLFEGALRLCGRNLVGYLVGGCLAMAWLPVQKVGRMVLFYGSTVVEIGLNAMTHLQQQMSWSALSPGQIFLALAAVYPLLGIVAVVSGWQLARRVRDLPPITAPQSQEQDKVSNKGSQQNQHSLLWLLLHLVAILSGLALLSSAPLHIGFIVVFSYVVLCVWHYPGVYRRFKKPGFWIFFVAITLLAGMFLGGLSDPDKPFVVQIKAEYLLIGLQMNLRAALLLIAFAALGVELGHPQIKKYLQRHGLGAYSLALEVAFTVMPQMLESLLHQGLKLYHPLRSLAVVLQQMEHWRVQLASAVQPTPVFILTGERGRGKTAALQILVAELKRYQINISGIIARGLWHNGKRSGFDVLDLHSGQSTPLCRVSDRDDGVRNGPFYFYEEGLSAGKQALSASSYEQAELIVVDEVGPLELGGKGWAAQLDSLLVSSRCPVVLSVRPRLVNAVIEHWSLPAVEVWQLDETNIVEMIEQLGFDLAQSVFDPYASKQNLPSSIGGE